MRLRRSYGWLLILLCAAACSVIKPAEHFGAKPVSYDQLAGWQQDDHSQALAAFLVTCPLMQKRNALPTAASHLQISAALWQSLCGEAQSVPQGDNVQARQFFERRFTPYRISNHGDEKGLFTGYYEPTLYGSYKKKGDLRYPIYAAPPELKNKKPYYTHAQIDHGALNKRHLEMVYVDDPVMIFFLHIQGSGRIRFGNGSEKLIGYADQNGHEYASLGKIAGDENLIPKDQINFFTLRQWLYDHPSKAFAMMERNPSYVFFHWLDQNGPVGSTGAVLTPQRSLAVDSNYIPYGLPLFLEADLPALPGAAPAPFHQLLIAQDTGGAIKGPVRGDVFFGHGDEAEYLAGYMKAHGVYSLLVPREIAAQLQ